MAKKAGKKQTIIIISAVLLLVLSVPLAVIYHNYTKETCVMDPVEHMGQREGISMDNILVEVEYWIITDGEFRHNALYIFENGDIYSGYCTQEDMERHRNYYDVNRNDRYWDYVYEPCYWGKLSPRDLNGITNELAQADDFDGYEREEYIEDRPDLQSNAETQEESTDDRDSDNIYKGHFYRSRIERDGTVFLGWTSRGSDEEIYMYAYDEHRHNAIDIVKSTWAYEQWTNQLFGEGWEERIDLKDELEEVEREREAEVGVVRQWEQYWKYVWDSILSLFF